MHVKFNLTSENISEFNDKIIAKYESINTSNDPSISQDVQKFAQKLSKMYEKFYPVFLVTDYQHGMYLALINSKRSNTHNYHQEDIDRNHQFFREYDSVHWQFLTLTTFEALSMNLRKLIVDTSSDQTTPKGQVSPKAISIKRISQDIVGFHSKIKPKSKEFAQFTNKLSNIIKKLDNAEIGINSEKLTQLIEELSNIAKEIDNTEIKIGNRKLSQLKSKLVNIAIEIDNTEINVDNEKLSQLIDKLCNIAEEADNTEVGTSNKKLTQLIGELSNIVEEINEQQKGLTENFWNYTKSYTIHLEDEYNADTTDGLFNLVTLEKLIDSIKEFFNILYSFYNYKEPASIANIGYQKTQHWIKAFNGRKYSMRLLSEHINGIARFSMLSEYLNLTPKEASKEILKKKVLEKEESCKILNLFLEGLKCQRLFRPLFRKFNPRFVVRIPQESNTLTPNEGVCSDTPV